MIHIPDLSASDIGRWVKYGPPGPIARPLGRVKSWNPIWIFVVYDCDGQWDRYQDFTAKATDPAFLEFIP